MDEKREIDVTVILFASEKVDPEEDFCNIMDDCEFKVLDVRESVFTTSDGEDHDSIELDVSIEGDLDDFTDLAVRRIEDTGGIAFRYEEAEEE